MNRKNTLRNLQTIIVILLISFVTIGSCNDNNGNGGDGGLGAPAPGPGASSGDRTVTIINKCSQPVWIGVVGADPDDQVTNCPTNPCPAGQACKHTFSNISM